MKAFLIFSLALITTLQAKAELSCEDAADNKYAAMYQETKAVPVPAAILHTLIPHMLQRSVDVVDRLCLPKDFSAYQSLQSDIRQMTQNLPNASYGKSLQASFDQKNSLLRADLQNYRARLTASGRKQELHESLTLFIAYQNGDKTVDMKCTTGWGTGNNGWGPKTTQPEQFLDFHTTLLCEANRKTLLKNGNEKREFARVYYIPPTKHFTDGIVESIESSSQEEAVETGCGCDS